MKTREGAASNGDETEGENLAGKDGTCAVYEASKCRHQHGRPNGQDSHGQSKDGAEFHECAEGAAGREQRPDGRYGGNKAIDHEHPGKADGAIGEMRSEARRFGDVTSTEHRSHD